MKAINWFKNLGIVKKALVLIVAFVVGMTTLAGVVSVADPEGFAQAQEETRQEQAERQAQAEARKAQKVEDDKRKAEEEQARKDAEASQKAQEAAQRQEEEARAQKAAEAENARQETVQAESSDPLVDLAGATGVEGTHVEWIGGNEGGLLKITFPVHDNFNADMIRTGAQKDTMSVLRAVKESNINYERVFIYGTFPMVDKSGNESQGIPLTAQYLPETVNAINYDEILVQEGVWDLADMHKADPDLFGIDG